MKINFDDIFQSSSHRLKYSQASKFSNFETNPTLTNSVALEKKDPKVIHTKLHETKPDVMNIIQRHKKEQGSYKWYKEFKYDQEPKKTKRKKKSSQKIDINGITKRLNQAEKCHREECQKLSDTHVLQRMKQQNLPLYAPKKNPQRTLTETNERLKKPSLIHDKLYREYIEKQFRHHERKQRVQEQQDLKPPIYENREYLTNYKKFYDRLDDEVNRKVNKQKYFETHPNVTLINQNHNLFKPDVSSSKKSLQLLFLKPSIKPKLMKKQQTHRMKTEATDALNNSFESVNRSVEIVQKTEEKLFNKITAAFQTDGFFKVNAENIQLLTETQFDILFPLIEQLQQEEEEVTIHEFESMFRKFYKKLDTKDKQHLRSHQIRRDKEIKAMRIELDSSRSRTDRSKKERSMRGKKPSDYLKKIENFV